VPVSVARFTGERSVIVEGWIGVSVGVGVGVGVCVRVISFSSRPVTASVIRAVKTGRTKEEGVYSS